MIGSPKIPGAWEEEAKPFGEDDEYFEACGRPTLLFCHPHLRGYRKRLA